MKQLKFLAPIVLFIAVALLGFQIIIGSIENQKYKRDQAELNHFKYGLFSVNLWKSKLANIVSDEIDNLYLTRSNKRTLKSNLESQLEVLIDKVSERIKKNNKDSALKQSIMDQFLDFEDIKKGIPDYAKAILAEMSSSKTENQLKGMLKEKAASFLEATYDTSDESKKNSIIAGIGAADKKEAQHKLQEVINRNEGVISEQALILIVIALLLFLIEAFKQGPLRPANYFILSLTLLVMLIVGVTTPMIDMEAKIAHFSFMLLDHPINFENQILYFQSKSIWDVFWIMITHKEIQMKLVGVLVVCFSIVFPVIKTVSALAYYFNYGRAQSSKVVTYFVMQSGKWSMADVLVVAIFMSYIGFNGIINSQLGNMAETANVELITTNGTSLQPGYYVFLSYTVLAMFLSVFIKNRPYTSSEKPTISK